MLALHRSDKDLIAFMANKIERDNLLIETIHPHIVDNIVLFWNSADFHSYINGLVVNSEAKDRQGFQFEVLSELGKLSRLHDELFPQYAQSKI